MYLLLETCPNFKNFVQQFAICILIIKCIINSKPQILDFKIQISYAKNAF